MSNIRNIVDDFITGNFSKNFKEKEYIFSDTSILDVTLYDHSVLTSGIAVSITKELLLRGKTSGEICKQSIEEKELIALVRFVSLLHCMEKYETITEKNFANVNQSLKLSEKILLDYKLTEPYFTLIQESIALQNLHENPKTLLQKIICLADSIASSGYEPAIRENGETSLKIAKSSSELYDEIFEGKKGLAVILGDVDRVHSYVFETSKLPEIRGGSELLNYLNYPYLEKLFEDKLAKECLIYNGGGSFLSVVPASMADSIIENIEKKYLDITGIATITCMKKEVEYMQFGFAPYANEDIKNLKDEGIGKWLIESHFGKNRSEWFENKKINGEECEILKKKSFGEIVSHLSAELRWKKDMKEYIPFYEALPIGRRCTSCGKRIAIDKIEYKKTGEELWLCKICKLKKDNGLEGKLYFRERFNNFLNTKNIEIENYYSKFPENLDELTGNSNYYAFIYADGNDIGALLEEIKTPAQYRHFAEKLKDATEKSVYEALYETLDKEKIKLKDLSFEIINIGGDDVIIIIAKPLAFKFSILLLKRFEENTKKIAKELDKKDFTQLTMSLGMAICKTKYPVYYAEKIAESLLKEAKTKAKERKPPKSAINYIYLTANIASESGKDLLDMYYTKNKKNAKLSLIMRPYTLDVFNSIYEKAKEIHQEKLLASTQGKAFQQILEKGRWEAYNFIYYQIARMPQYKRGRLINILTELSKMFGCDETILWKLETDSSGLEYSTYLFDLLELAEVGGDSIEQA
ncbi:MAG: hypothetical protein L6265_06890 [Thermoplasmatales archaeon]|nr:hypothetical protein [Candidatus Methanoperedenaceae archaeon]MCG2826299.1 hypothetical protein [Thermoplasmatales archaeon]